MRHGLGHEIQIKIRDTIHDTQLDLGYEPRLGIKDTFST